jgi:hypothetical protein
MPARVTLLLSCLVLAALAFVAPQAGAQSVAGVPGGNSLAPVVQETAPVPGAAPAPHDLRPGAVAMWRAWLAAGPLRAIASAPSVRRPLPSPAGRSPARAAR